MTTKIFGLAGAGALAAGLLGFSLGRGTSPRPAPPMAMRPPSVLSAPVTPERVVERAPACRGADTAALADDLRRIVRQELAAREPPARTEPVVDDPSGSRSGHPVTPEPAPDPALQARAERLVDGALASRRLSYDDAMELDHTLGRLSNDDRVALVSQLYEAINTGAVKPEPPPQRP